MAHRRRPVLRAAVRGPAVSPPSRWGRRALLSAVAGGGLTAAGLIGPLATGARAGAPVPVPQALTATTSGPTGPASPGPSGASGSTGPAPAPTAPAQSPAPATSTGASGSSGPPPYAPPTVVATRRQHSSTDRRPAVAVAVAVGRVAAPKPAPNPAQVAGPVLSGPNGVALAPQLVANQFGVLNSPLEGTTVSAAALRFYRIPMFLLPIYQAAAIQYGVPWQVLAAINEVETDYGRDLSVSSAGALGWMQFLPETWLQYGVDASNAGFADPYNPADAIFAAARYLRAAGAQTDLRSAVYAYNHSDSYVASVLLRARLIAAYPEPVIASLTGLTEGRAPVAGGHVDAYYGPPLPSPYSAAAASVPAAAAAAATAAPPASASALERVPRRVDIAAAPGSAVVAVQDGRVIKLGRSTSRGNYVLLSDVYGNQYEYAGLGRLASRYLAPQPVPAPRAGTATISEAEPARDPAPSAPATAGRQPTTLRVTVRHSSSAPALAPVAAKVRLFAHASAAAPSAPSPQAAAHGPKAPAGMRWLNLEQGSTVTAGTVLGTVRLRPRDGLGHFRFAVKPAGDARTVDPRSVLTNWQLLQTAIHPAGARGSAGLLGATAGDVFLMSKAELERTVLSDPGISIYACGRQDIASGLIDERVLAVLAFLSRDDLKPTVSALRCGHSELTTSGNISEHSTGDAVDISAINGIAIAGHQGVGTVTDTTIQALLSLQGEYVPHQIISLMTYPGASNTLALPDHWNHIHVGFRPVGPELALRGATTASAARRAVAGAAAPTLSASAWDRLIATVAALPSPRVSRTPSPTAIRDPQAAPGNRTLGLAPGRGH